MRLGLAQKLIVMLTAAVVFVGVVAGYVSIHAQEVSLLRAIILGADQLSKSITGATWQAMLADNRQGVYDVMDTIAHKQGIERIRMFSREGRVMFSTQPGQRNEVATKTREMCAACHQGSEPKVNLSPRSRVRIFSAASGRRSLMMVTPIYNEPSCSRSACHAHPAGTKVLGILDVTFNLEQVDREVASARLRMLAIFTIQILLISGLIVVFVRRFLQRPINQLIAAAHRVSEMNLDESLDGRESPDELGELARSFDTMRERLRVALHEITQFTQQLESKVQERTEQLKTAQQKLMQNDRLASLGQLAASVAHEINNPVNGVLTLSMLMQRILTDEGIPDGRVPEFRKYLGQITGETTRVGRIVSDLLSFSRRSKPQRAQADLNQIVASTISLISHKLALSNVALELVLDERLPSVLCDASQMQQVVLNLVLNAAEATQKKAERRVEVRTRHNAAANTVELEVGDNGEGIPEANLLKIFDPFFTTKPEGKGVGLGLAVLYGIVQSHGGDVAVASSAGKGTTFTVSLPLAPEAAAEEAGTHA